VGMGGEGQGSRSRVRGRNRCCLTCQVLNTLFSMFAFVCWCRRHSAGPLTADTGGEQPCCVTVSSCPVWLKTITGHAMHLSKAARLLLLACLRRAKPVRCPAAALYGRRHRPGQCAA
jgi:hypothetical protein